MFSGMNIHLPAILMFTRGTRFWHTAISLFVLLPGRVKKRSHQAWAPKAWQLLDRWKPRAQQLRASAGCEGPGWAFRNRSKGTASRDYVWIWLKIRILLRIFTYFPTCRALFPAFEVWDIEIFLTVWKNHFLKEADPRCRRRKRSKVPAQAQTLGEKQQRQSYVRCSSRLNLILDHLCNPVRAAKNDIKWCWDEGAFLAATIEIQPVCNQQSLGKLYVHRCFEAQFSLPVHHFGFQDD